MGKKYCVYMKEQWVRRIDVEAESEEEAKDLAVKAAESYSCGSCTKTERPPQAYFDYEEDIGRPEVEEWAEKWHGPFVGIPPEGAHTIKGFVPGAEGSVA